MARCSTPARSPPLASTMAVFATPATRPHSFSSATWRCQYSLNSPPSPPVLRRALPVVGAQRSMAAAPTRGACTTTSAASTDIPSLADQTEVVHVPLAHLTERTSQALLALGFASRHAALITEVRGHQIPTRSLLHHCLVGAPICRDARQQPRTHQAHQRRVCTKPWSVRPHPASRPLTSCSHHRWPCSTRHCSHGCCCLCSAG